MHSTMIRELLLSRKPMEMSRRRTSFTGSPLGLECSDGSLSLTILWAALTKWNTITFSM